MRYIPIFLTQLLVAAAAGADITVDAWARATPPGSTTAAIYGSFINNSERDRSVAAIDFAGANHVMVHRTVESEGMSRMKAGRIDIPAGSSVELRPGALHIMVMGLSDRLMEGCEYPITLTWEDGAVSQHSFRTGGFGQMRAPDKRSEPCRRDPPPDS